MLMLTMAFNRSMMPISAAALEEAREAIRVAEQKKTLELTASEASAPKSDFGPV